LFELFIKKVFHKQPLCVSFFSRKSRGIIFHGQFSITSLLEFSIRARGKTGRGGRSRSRGYLQNTSNRGFPAMDPDQRQIASKGGRASHSVRQKS